MSDFPDVEQFAREHAGCGGLTPKTTSRPGTAGYHLTITCVCRATHDRWVTAEEAGRPLPRPAPLRASAPAKVPSWPAHPSPPRPQRAEVNVHSSTRRSRKRAVWLLLALLLLGSGAAAYLVGPDFTLTPLGPPAKPTVARPFAPPSPSRPAEPPVRAPLAEITRSLRELQAVITPSVALNDYASRVLSTRVDVERVIGAISEPARAQAHDILEVHRLATAAWSARVGNDKDEWIRVGQDPAIELCPTVKRAVEAAGPVSRAAARGAAVGSSLQQLWDCAAERLATLDRLPAGG